MNISLLIEFTREYNVDLDARSLWDFLTHVERITTCIPDLESLQIVSGNRFKGKVRPRFSFIKGKLNLECEILVIEEGRSFRLDVQGSSIGATFSVIMDVSIDSGEASGMRVKVRGETLGLLKAIPRSLIQQIVEETEKSMLACIKERVGAVK